MKLALERLQTCEEERCMICPKGGYSDIPRQVQTMPWELLEGGSVTGQSKWFQALLQWEKDNWLGLEVWSKHEHTEKVRERKVLEKYCQVSGQSWGNNCCGRPWTYKNAHLLGYVICCLYSQNIEGKHRKGRRGSAMHWLDASEDQNKEQQQREEWLNSRSMESKTEII